MSRSIPIHVIAKKGAAHRALSEAMERARAAEGAAELPASFRRALDAARIAANKLISAAGRSDQVEIGISVHETPTGGWDAFVQVTVPTPTFREA